MTDYTVPLLWLVVIAAGAGTLGVKLSFILALARTDGMGPRLEWVLAFVPPAVLAALVAPAVVVPDGTLVVGPRLLAAGVAGAVAWRTGNAAATIGVGMGTLWVLRAFPFATALSP